jgi:hypothetical protein
MLCGNHYSPFSPISYVEQWPQAKRAATYQERDDFGKNVLFHHPERAKSSAHN